MRNYSSCREDFATHSLIFIHNFDRFVLLQHPFINRELDTKPIRDLLLEYKAEVVEEEVVDEDTDVSTIR